ncbi:MAG: hypothetical protein PVI90_15045 [Desulfobacteraceae bacterium]|jgi:antitoxin component YwqK of YwqJK toxin-antitoxin module
MKSKNKNFGKTNLFLGLFFILTLIGCSQEVPKSQTQIKNGRLYRIGESTPFTGYVVGKSREGYRSDLCTYKKKYVDGILKGKSKFWYPDGTLESVEPYENGKLNGIVVRYYPNGRVKAHMHLVNGERGGDKGEAFYSPEGKRIR